MLEIELKFRVHDLTPISNHLQHLGASAGHPLEESDHYFNAPDRDFAQTDEAFRLRSVGDRNCMTYKGPKTVGIAKTRTEIEIAIESGEAAADAFRRLVQCLGYRPTAIVKKRRNLYNLRRDGFPLVVCLDDVETLGTFVEIEIICTPSEKERAERIVLEVAREFELEVPETRSYLEMILANLA